MLTLGKPVGLGEGDSPFLPAGGQDLPLGDSNPAWVLQGKVAPQTLGAGPSLPAGHPWVSHQAPDFCNFGVARGLWDLLSCLPPLALPVLCMVAQEPLAGGLSPLPGVQTATAPWPGFPSCLMAAGALNLSRGPSQASRARGVSAIPAMYPLSRDQQRGETLSHRAPPALSS